MSEVLHIQEPALWMQPSSTFDSRLLGTRVGDAYAFNPGSESVTNAAGNDWRFYGGEAQDSRPLDSDKAMSQNYQQQQLHHSPQTRVKQNKRAFSHSNHHNSTTQMYESRPPAYTRGNILQPSATFDRSSSAVYDPASYDNDMSTYTEQHLPTPSQTPTSDTFLLDRVLNNKQARSKSVAQVDTLRGPQSGMLDPSSFDIHAPSHSPGLSVSSYGPDMPATPQTINSEHGDDHLHVASGEPDTYPFSHLDSDDGLYFEGPIARPHTKLTRTISDIYQDELYSPINVTSAPAHAQYPHLQKPSLLSPYRNMVNDRLQAAHDARASLSPLASHSRIASPFRPGSSYAIGSGNTYGNVHGHMVNVQSHGRGHQSYNYPSQQPYQEETEEQQSKTISPKDAVLDFQEPTDESTSSLFPENSTESRIFGGNDFNSYGRFSQTTPTTSYEAPQSQYGFQAPGLPMQLSQQSSSQEYRFPALPARQSSNLSAVADQPPDFPAHLVSMETTRSEPNSPSPSPQSPFERPASTNANTGTYTCTYHGCTQRFASPALLQRHKKEGHRSMTGTRGKSQSPNDESESSHKSSQAGPHRCDHINPATGKPCNVVFSRPYDLTRHEDTIHAQRTKARCQYCKEEKTFSRNDALTRHMRVVHPDVSFPGKHRRRNAGNN